MKHWACLILLFSATSIFADTVQQRAADFICEAEKKSNLNRLAVFAFTDADGEETDKSGSEATLFLSALASCNAVTIIDKSKEEDILEQQAFEQTGAVDATTMVPVGQLTGADSLLFGIYRDSGLEVRLLNAKTGELIAAQIFTIDAAAAAPADPDYYTKRWLVDSVQAQPPVYLYVTSSPGEWNILCARQPYLERYYNNLSPAQQQQLGQWRDRVDFMRKNNTLPQSHQQQFRRDALVHGREHVREKRTFNNARRYHTRTGERHARRQGSGERFQGRQGHAQGRGEGNRGHHGGRGGHSGGHHGGPGGHGGRR
jgi:hypothetical protein